MYILPDPKTAIDLVVITHVISHSVSGHRGLPSVHYYESLQYKYGCMHTPRMCYGPRGNQLDYVKFYC